MTTAPSAHTNAFTRQHSQPAERRSAARSALDFIIRAGVIAGGISLMGWASLSSVGCAAGNGKYTEEHKNAAKEKMDGLKAATEYQMSLQALQAGDLEKALRHCDRAVQLAPNVSRTWVLRARVNLERNELEQTAAALARATELDPNGVDVAYYSGLLAERVARRDEALTHYLRAAELDPTNPQYVLAAAEMMVDVGRTDDAEKLLLDRLETFRHTAGIQQTLGHIAMMRQNYPAAVERFNQARLLAPDEFDVLEDLARAQFLAEQYAEAEANFKRLLRNETYAQRRDLSMMQAKSLMALGRRNEARDLLVTLSENESAAADVETWIALGQAAFEARDMPRLRLSFTRVIAMAPDRPEGYVLRGLHLRRMGDYASALAEFRRAIDRGETAEQWVLVGLTFQDMSRPADARRAFDKALELDPADATARSLRDSVRASAPTGD